MRRAALVLAASAAFLFSGVSIAATKVPVKMPSARAVANGGGQAVKDGDRVRVPGDGQTEYIQATPGGTKGTPVKVIPTIDYSIPRTITQTKNLLKANVGQIVVGGVIAGMVAGLDWVMGEGGQVKKKEQSVGGLPVSTTGNTFAPDQICYQKPASQTLGKVTTTTNNGVLYAVIVSPSVGSASGLPSGYQFNNNCTQQSNGYTYNAQGYWPQSGHKVIALTDIQTTLTPLAEADYSKVDTFVNGQAADWLKNLLKESCEGSNNPDGCFDSLVDQSALSGPTYVSGPRSSTLVSGPGGVKQVETQTNFNIKYGPNYFTWNAVTQTTTVNPDGTTETETTTEGEEETEEQPQEEEDLEPPSLDDAYKPVIDKYDSIAQDIEDVDGLASGINYAPWYSFGGACHEIEAELPVIGMWRTAYCPYIENMVRPVLAFLFFLFTWHRCYSMWQEAVRVGRPI
ncbi:hypothetical protein [Pseudomonas sp. TCU-HL1]|uniref:hypothetical protein n=1 Tax=Pseudomonas sp. TCU-HL1 TaxID=1856685 RepID=UPI00083E03F2|nr:hypothetical protein [Pseudomonas sp. TCU-HL1]AOE85583.1 hypothetical protein THL1_3035 [Pseudomonas sp. TCU-HL1]AOE85596.1 hypothetical protein THL1_3048 [Pseudomonas sp. TCU-HL1]